MKKIVERFISLIMACAITGCSYNKIDKSNPISDKDTDQRIIMCLEEVYPDHKFNIVKSFDKKNGKGVFADENGLEFIVRDLIYDNSVHFGCNDEYLFTILQQEKFIEKVKQIVEEKYKQKIFYDQDNISIDIIFSEENKITIEEVSQLIKEILNVVETPKVDYHENQEFSTNVVNYYTLPAWGVIQCYFQVNGRGTAELFYFSDKNISQEEIEVKLNKLYDSIISKE